MVFIYLVAVYRGVDSVDKYEFNLIFPVSKKE